LKLIAGLLGVFFLYACSGNPSLPTREIDRPYTLPDDTATWNFGFMGAVNKIEGFRRTGAGIPYMNWESSLGDNLTLEWNGLPPALRYQIFHKERDTLGLRAALLWGYTSRLGTIYSPSLKLYYRRILGNDFALEIVPGYERSRSTRENIRDGWEAQTEIYGVMQLSEKNSLHLGIVPTYSKNRGWVFHEMHAPRADKEFVVPLRAKLQRRMTQQWEIYFRTHYDRLGRKNRYYYLEGDLGFNHYW
jgi:hypothetical protein